MNGVARRSPFLLAGVTIGALTGLRHRRIVAGDAGPSLLGVSAWWP